MRLRTSLRAGLRRLASSLRELPSRRREDTRRVFGLLVLAGLWTISHAAPEIFGSCHQVALHLGHVPTVRECQAYGPSEFLIPLAVLALIAMVVSGHDEFSSEIPGVGKFRRTCAAKDAAKQLHTDSVDRRAEDFLTTALARGAAPPPRELPSE
jgi:hypothetical protein